MITGKIFQKFRSPENELGFQTVVYGFGKISYKAVAFILVPLYLRYLTPFDYGILEILFIIRLLIINTITMGIPNTVFRFYSAKDNKKERRKIISTAFWIFLTIQVPVFVVLVQFNKSIAGILLGSPAYGPYVAIVGANIFLIAFRNVPLALYRAQKRAVMFTSVSLIIALATLLANLYFVAVLQKGIAGILWGNFTGGLIGCALVLPSLFKEIGVTLGLREALKVLKFGAPLALAQLPNQVIQYSDRFILRYMVSYEAVGVYALAAKLGNIVNVFFINAFQLAWEPFFFSVIGEDNKEARLNPGLVLFSFWGMTIVVIISLYAFNIIKIIAPPEFYRAYKIVPLICYGFFFGGFYQLLRMGLLAVDKTSQLPVINVLGLIVSVSLNFALTPLLGVLGPAIVLPVTYLAMTLLATVKAQQSYLIKYNFKPVFMIIFTGTIIIIISGLIHFNTLCYDLVYKTTLLGIFLLIMHQAEIIQQLKPRLLRKK